MGLGAVDVSVHTFVDWGNWLVEVSMDGAAGKTYNASTFWKVPDAVLFFESGLDPTKNHSIKITNTTPQMKLALNSIRVYNVETAQNATVTSSSTATPSVQSPSTSITSVPSKHSGVSAGVVAGPIIGVLLLGLICGLVWWRSRRSRASPPRLDTGDNDPYTDRPAHRPMFPSTGYSGSDSAIALNSPGNVSTYSVQTTQVSGPPGATVMTWGPADYDEERNMSPSIYSASHARTTVANSSTYAPSSDGTASDFTENRVPVGKMRATEPSPLVPGAAPPALDSPDVDRLIELIAQRIDRGRGQDESAPPEYRG